MSWSTLNEKGLFGDNHNSHLGSFAAQQAMFILLTKRRLMQLFLAHAEHVDGFEAVKLECGGAPDLRRVWRRARWGRDACRHAGCLPRAASHFLSLVSESSCVQQVQ